MNQNKKFRKILYAIAAISFLAAPILFGITFVIVAEGGISELVDYKFQATPQPDIDPKINESIDYQWRYDTLGDIFGLFGMIPLTIVCVYLTVVTFPKKPWFAIFGGIFSVFGIVFMSALFGAGLMQYAIRAMPFVTPDLPFPSIDRMMKEGNFWGVAEMFAILSLICPVVLMTGAIMAKVIKRIPAMVFILGCLIMFFFFDVRSFQFLGSVFMLIGSVLIVNDIYKNKIMTE